MYIIMHHKSLCMYITAHHKSLCMHARTHTHTHTHTGVSITPCPAPPLSLHSPFLPTHCPVCTPSLRASKLTSHHSPHYAAPTLTSSVDSTLSLSSSEKRQQRQCLFVVEDGVRLV